jgi:hypothetical protein
MNDYLTLLAKLLRMMRGEAEPVAEAPAPLPRRPHFEILLDMGSTK